MMPDVAPSSRSREVREVAAFSPLSTRRRLVPRENPWQAGGGALCFTELANAHNRQAQQVAIAVPFRDLILYPRGSSPSETSLWRKDAGFARFGVPKPDEKMGIACAAS